MTNLECFMKKSQINIEFHALEILKNEGLDDLEVLKYAKEEDLRLAGLKVGDLVQIRRLQKQISIESLEDHDEELDSSISGSIEHDSSLESSRVETDENTSFTDKVNSKEEEQSKDGTIKYSAEQLLAQASNNSKCTDAQICFRNLLRDSAKQAKIWQKAYTLPEITDNKFAAFCDLIRTGAPQLRGHIKEVRERLSMALQNRRKYLKDISTGKRTTKKVKKDTNMTEHESVSITRYLKSVTENGSPKLNAKRKLETDHKQEPDKCQTSLTNGDKVNIFKDKNQPLALCTYLGPEDEMDKNDMYSLLHMNKNFLADDDQEVSLPKETSEGETTLNELKENAIFVWKTSKINKCHSEKAREPANKKTKLITSKKSGKENDQSSKTLESCQGHHGKDLKVNNWVSVAYNDGFYIGQITAINNLILDDETEVDVDFLSKKGRKYCCPKTKDIDTINSKFIFVSTVDLLEVGGLYNLKPNDAIAIKNLYQQYKVKYF